MRSSQLLYLLHLARHAGQMHGNDRLSAGSNPPRGICGIKIHRAGLDVNQHRLRCEVTDHFGGGGKGCGGQQNFVPSLNPNGFQRKVKGRRAGGNGDGMTRSDISGKLPFKLEGPLAHSEPSGTDYVGRSLRFLLADRSYMERHCHYAGFLSHTLHSLDEKTRNKERFNQRFHYPEVIHVSLLSARQRHKYPETDEHHQKLKWPHWP